jgi:EAL and modified HD-GYP domain-containing signal transduction protein
VNQLLNDSPQMPTKGGMSVLADPPAGRPDVAVVRQPIADDRHTVVGYELLFGGGRVSQDSSTDAKATSALLVDAFGDIGLEVLAGRHPAWMSIARNFLIEIGPPPVRPDRAVLQIAAYAARDDLLAVLQTLGRSGYTLALYDYDGSADVEPLLGLCSIVKVSIGERDDATLAEIISTPKLHGALLVATGVASTEDFDRSRALGFSYFQGDFFAKPRLVRHRGVGTGGISSLRALGELSAADASFDDLERIISSDVGLSLKLLRYVNSAFFALPRNIGSVREALTLLGTRTVRRWATVMAMSAIPDAPHELVSIALHRARMCEMLAGSALPEERETLFTIGLFSVADALLDAPMEEVLESLPFSDEIRAALLRREGPKGELLSSVLAYERGEFPNAPATPSVSLAGAYRAALEWADEAHRAVAG